MPARLVNAGRGQSRLQITARFPEDDETARLAGWRANAQKPERSSCRIRFRAGPFEATKSGIGGTRRPPPPTQILIRLPMPDMRTPGACAGRSFGTGGSARAGGLTGPPGARDRASRGGHDERRPGASPAPLRRGRGAGVRACAGRPPTVAVSRKRSRLIVMHCRNPITSAHDFDVRECPGGGSVQ